MLNSQRFLGQGSRLSLACLGLFLAGCASSSNPAVVAPSSPSAALPAIEGLPEGGTYKVGNPYQIAGTWYYPAENYAYVEEGIASWYGADFHGKRTANGERYDMNAVTAAHPTLPLPSIVRVTNLDNGRVLTVRINDRGPFHGRRIIDLSRRSAQLLGFYEAGTARVRVEIEAQESLDLKNIALARSPQEMPRVAAVPRGSIAAQPLAPVTVTGNLQPTVSAPAKPASPPQAKPAAPPVAAKPAVAVPTSGPATGLFIQAGAFSEISNAHRLEQQLKELGVGSVLVLPVEVNDQEIFRVRLGPLVDQKMADTLLARVQSYGYGDAQIVRD